MAPTRTPKRKLTSTGQAIIKLTNDSIRKYPKYVLKGKYETELSKITGDKYKE